MDIRAILILGIIALFAFFLLWREGLLKKDKYIVIALVALAAAFIIRGTMLDFRSADYNTFLVKWMDYFRQNGGFAALKSEIGNYNIPYLCFLAAFSYSSINDLYLIKFLSIFFDVMLAFSMMKLAGIYTRSPGKRLAAFLITLFLPTVVLNGAMWGQCDSIYVSLALIALWLVLSGKPKWSMVFMALSFGFKLQAVFILPVYLVMLFAKKIKFWDYLIFPATYIVLILPAVLAGRPFMDALTLYFNQADSIGTGLNYNSPSLCAFLNSSNKSTISVILIASAFALIFIIYIFAWLKRKNLNNAALLFITLLMVVGIPYLLPRMHDRYFFMADVLTVLPAIVNPAYIPLAVLTSFASFNCYYWYLTLDFLFPSSYGAIALLGVILVLIITVADKLNSRRFDKI